MRKLLVTFSLILALFGSSVIVNAAVQKGTVNISSTLDGTALIDGTDSQKDMGSVLDLDATEVGNGNEFAFWIVNGFVRTDLPAETQLRVQSKMNLVAVFRSEGKHAVLFVDSNGKLIDDVYVADGGTATAPSTTKLTKPGGLTVVADEANRWISLEGNTSLAGINSSRVYVLQYEMPATSVEIKAIGAVLDTFTANKNDVVTVVAADTANFKYWADDKGNVLSYNPTYSFTVLGATTIKAIKEGESVTAESFVKMTELTGIRSGHVSYMGRYELHGGDELVEFGFIYGNTIGDIEMGMPNVDVAISNVANPATNEFLMSFVDGHHDTARAYAIVRNGEAIRTIYSDLVVKPNVKEIEDIRGLAENTNVNSYGIVSGIMGTKYVFVQQKDGSAGIVLHNATIPAALAVGDEVIIRGTMGAYNGLVQINNGTFEILNSGNTVPLAEDTVTLLSSLTTADQGRRFSIDGLTVVSVSGQDLKVKDSANNEITIRVDQNQTSYTDLMEFVASLVPGEVIAIKDMHMGWYKSAQFLLINVSEITRDSEFVEGLIIDELSKIEGKEFNEKSTVSLPSVLLGTEIEWTFPEGVVVDGKFLEVDEDTEVTLTAVFQLVDREEVAVDVRIMIIDIPEGSTEPELSSVTVLFGTTNTGSTNDLTLSSFEKAYGSKFSPLSVTSIVVSKAYGSANASIKFGSSKAGGSLKMTFDNSSIVKVVVIARAYGASEDAKLKVNGISADSNLSMTSAEYTFEFDATNSITIEGSSKTTKNRFHLDSIIIYYSNPA